MIVQVLGPATHRGNPQRVLGSCLWHEPEMRVAGISLSFSLSVSVCVCILLLLFQVNENKYIFKRVYCILAMQLVFSGKENLVEMTMGESFCI